MRPIGSGILSKFFDYMHENNQHTIEKAPIRFIPYYKTVIWGGTKICDYQGVRQSEPNVGECWEISAVDGHESVVESGPYAGKSISELIGMFGAQLLGAKVMEKYHGRFPLLVKLIDANDNLSVQVHPDDDMARERHDSLGKTELWYIIQAEKGAKIYSGMRVAIDPRQYQEHVAAGTFEDLVAVHDSAPGDVFFLPAGRVHAIGAGNFLAEIQESSDVTYRIYDYNRRDAAGNLRELHTELAKDAIDYQVYDDYKSPPVPDDVADVEIVNCDHFVVRRVKVDGRISLTFNPESFAVVMCLEGEVTLEYPGGADRLTRGCAVLCPAVMTSVEVSGKATLLISQANV